MKGKHIPQTAQPVGLYKKGKWGERIFDSGEESEKMRMCAHKKVMHVRVCNNVQGK